MSRLPKIPSYKAPVEKPAEDAKTYPDLRMSRLVINSPQTSDKTPASCTLEPYNYETQEYGPASESVRIEFEDVEAAAARYAAEGFTDLATAMGAVVVAVQKLVAREDIAALEQNGVIEIKEPD